MQQTREHLWCFPTVLLKLEVWTHAHIRQLTAFPAVTTNSNPPLNPFNYTLLHHTQHPTSALTTLIVMHTITKKANLNFRSCPLLFSDDLLWFWVSQEMFSLLCRSLFIYLFILVNSNLTCGFKYFCPFKASILSACFSHVHMKRHEVINSPFQCIWKSFYL